MVNVSIDVTDLGGEARPGDKVVFWRPRMGGSATHAGRVISTAPVTVFLTDGKATVSDVEPGEMTVLLQCRGVESQGPVTVSVPDGDHTVTLRALLESQFEYAPPIVSAVQEAASIASASEEAAVTARIRSEAAADRADAKVDDAINNGANLIRNEVKQDADRAVDSRERSESARDEAETYSSGAEQAALVATNARDRSISEADLSEDAAAVSVATAIGLGDEFNVRISSLEAMNGVAPETPVDGQTASLVEQPETLTRAALDGVYPSTSITAVRVPKSLTFEGIQDALDEAKASGETVVAGGVIDTDKTLIIQSNCDFSQLVINYSGAGTAVRVGTTEGVTWRLSARLPQVRHTGKTSLGWGQVAGTIGVELVNLNSCPEILVPRVSRFEVGLAEIGTNGRGHAYNTITIGHLENNKRNQVMMSAGSGWCNENLHLGGRFSHELAEGESVPGVKHIDLESADSNQINNNVWIKPSLEGVGNEWALDCGGTYNRIIAGRWERTGGARVRWGNNASYNVIEGGYHADRILSTRGSGATRNEINSPNRHEFFGTSTDRGVGVFLNTSSRAAPAWEIIDPSQQDQWTWRAAANSIQGRRIGEAHPRIFLNSEQGQLLMGSGVSAPSVGFAPVGSSALRVYGNVNFENEMRLRSPDGSLWKILVGDDGEVSTQKL